jgi:hypothetical protein
VADIPRCEVSEVIALKIRRPDAERPYLYPQLFVALSYLAASGIMWELLRVKRKQRKSIAQLSAADTVEISDK